VSLGGAFIEMMDGECPAHAPVTLLLPFENADRARLLQVPAMVVRVR
jgi:hypothetical protein